MLERQNAIFLTLIRPHCVLPWALVTAFKQALQKEYSRSCRCVRSRICGSLKSFFTALFSSLFCRHSFLICSTWFQACFDLGSDLKWSQYLRYACLYHEGLPRSSKASFVAPNWRRTVLQMEVVKHSAFLSKQSRVPLHLWSGESVGRLS